MYGLNPNAKLLFLYFLTNKRIELTGAYELPIPIMSVETLLTDTEIKKALEELYPKVAYIDGYVVIMNASKYQNYNKGNSYQKQAYEKEYENLPESVKAFLEGEMMTSPMTSRMTSYRELDRNKNTEIRNKNIENRKKKKKKKKKKKEEGEEVSKVEMELKEIVDFYNEVFERAIRSTRGFEKNFEYWREVHDMEKIKRAIVVSRQDKFWRDKMTLEILLRTKNPNGEAVDRIEQLSNKSEEQQGNIAII